MTHKIRSIVFVLCSLVGGCWDSPLQDDFQDVDSLRTHDQALRENDASGRNQGRPRSQDSQDETFDIETSSDDLADGYDSAETYDLASESTDEFPSEPNPSVPSHAVANWCTTDLVPRPREQPYDPAEEARRNAEYVPSLWSDDHTLPPPGPRDPEAAAMAEVALDALAEIPVEPNEMRVLLEDYRAVGCADDRVDQTPRCVNHPYILALEEEWNTP